MAKYPNIPKDTIPYTAPNGMGFQIGDARGYPYWLCNACGKWNHGNHGHDNAEQLANEHSHQCRYSPDRPKPPANDE